MARNRCDYIPCRVGEEAWLRLQIKGRNVEVSESLRSFAEEKLSKLDRHLHDATELELELSVERNPAIEENQVAEATVWTKGPVLRATERSSDMRASIDLLSEKLLRQAQRYRDKRRRGGGRGAVKPARGESADAETDDADAIVKTKQFPVKPMTPDEAVLQLELVGHDFFVFQNAESDAVNVVYRRRDGRYGLIEPEIS